MFILGNKTFSDFNFPIEPDYVKYEGFYATFNFVSTYKYTVFKAPCVWVIQGFLK